MPNCLPKIKLKDGKMTALNNKVQWHPKLSQTSEFKGTIHHEIAPYTPQFPQVWKQPRCPPKDGYINKMWSPYPVGHF